MGITQSPNFEAKSSLHFHGHDDEGGFKNLFKKIINNSEECGNGSSCTNIWAYFCFCFVAESYSTEAHRRYGAESIIDTQYIYL